MAHLMKIQINKQLIKPMTSKYTMYFRIFSVQIVVWNLFLWTEYIRTERKIDHGKFQITFFCPSKESLSRKPISQTTHMSLNSQALFLIRCPSCRHILMFEHKNRAISPVVLDFISTTTKTISLRIVVCTLLSTPPS